MLISFHASSNLIRIENLIRRDEGILIITRILDHADELELTLKQREKLSNLVLERNAELDEDKEHA